MIISAPAEQVDCEKGLILPFIVVEKNLTNKIKNNHTDSLITILVGPAVHNFVLCSLLVAIPLLFLIDKPFFLCHVSPVSVSMIQCQESTAA